MIGNKELLKQIDKNSKKIENFEKYKEEVVVKYLRENRYFKEEEFFNELEIVIEKEIQSSLENTKESLEKIQSSKETIRGRLKEEKEKLEKEKRKYFLLSFIPKILIKYRILLEPTVGKRDIIILKGKEAEFFSFIFFNYKSSDYRFISENDTREAIIFLDIQNELEDLFHEKVLSEVKGGGIVSNIDCSADRDEVYKNKQIERMIFDHIVSVNINNKIHRVNENIRKTEEAIKNFNNKIEKDRIDIIVLLGIFVAIISIVYANISVAMSDTLSSVIVTNISTVACIFFLLTYVEVFIKNQNKENKLRSYGWGLIVIVALAINIWFYKKIQYDKNNFIKYMENIYELKNKETAFLELQHFTMPSDY